MPATLVSPTGTPVALGDLDNITIGGAEFDLDASLRPGTEMKLSFEIPEAAARS